MNETDHPVDGEDAAADTGPGLAAEVEPAAPTQGLGTHVARGFVSTGASQLLRILMQVASVVVLSRLLTPHDYGLVAMVIAITGVAELFRDMGLSTAAIQAKTLTTAQRDNLWWLNTGIGVALMAIVIGIAPLVAWAYQEPATLPIVIAMGPNLLLNSMSTQYRANLSRALRFHTLAALDLSLQGIGLAFGIVLAVLGVGYWALVGQTLLSSFVGLIALVVISRWLPGRFRRGEGTGAFVKLGWSYLISGLLFYAAINVDAVVIARLFGSGPLGLYNRGVQLVRIPIKMVTAPANAVLMPVMARVQDDDDRMRNALRTLTMTLMYPIVLVMLVFTTAPFEVIWIALGAKWTAGAPVMAWIAAGSAVSTMSSCVSTAMAAKGSGKAVAWSSTFTLVATLVGLVVGSQWGIEGIAAAVAIAALLTWPVSFVLLDKIAGLRAYGIFRQSAAVVIAAGVGFVAVSALVRLVPWEQHILRLVTAVVGSLAYMAALALLPRFRRDYQQLAATIMRLRK